MEILDNLGVTIDLSGIKRASAVFYRCKFSRIGVVDVSKSDNIINMFYDSPNLETIDELLIPDTSMVPEMFFMNCPKLKNVKITAGKFFYDPRPNMSSELTEESVRSIVEALADLTGSIKQKITFHSSVLDRMPDELTQMVINKNWEFA